MGDLFINSNLLSFIYFISLINFLSFLALSNAKHEESIVIGLAASSTSMGPQVKTTKPVVSIKITNCSIFN